MTRQLNRLSARFVATVTEAGRYADGGNLYLAISPNGGRRWVFLYQFQGRQREAGLGSAPRPGASSAEFVTLAEARTKRDEMLKHLKAGRDPIEARKATEAVKIPTFGEFADDLVSSLEGGFRNEKHKYQWKQTLGDAYCKAIRSKRVDQITTEDVLAVLKPHWALKQETASRLRGRIEKTLDAAKARGLIASPWENPARWRGHLENLLSRRQKLQRGHQPALSYEKVPAFIGRLRERDAIAARALEFLILTATRSAETRDATWAEIDFETRVWTIEGGRTKTGRPHRVPLPDRALEIVGEMKAHGTGAASYVFPGARKGRPLSNMAFAQLLERMGEAGFVPHGFRSSFRDWAGDSTQFPREIVEEALAHLVGSSVERAYRRLDGLERRRELMRAWAIYIEPKPANVVPLRRA